MKLQINAKGSWRDVLAFDDAHVDAVRNTARELLTLARGQLSLGKSGRKSALARRRCRATCF